MGGRVRKPLPAAALSPAIKGGRFRQTPYRMDKADITPEQNEAAQRISLEIFTDMSNAGFSLREALAAIYVSGIAHAISVFKESHPVDNSL